MGMGNKKIKKANNAGFLAIALSFLIFFIANRFLGSYYIAAVAFLSIILAHIITFFIWRFYFPQK